MGSYAGNDKNNSWMSPRDQEYVESAVTYVRDLAKDMEDLIKKLQKMGTLGLFGDGKVPEKKKSFFNRVSFRSSDKVAALKDTQKYLDFFKAMLKNMKKLSGDMQMSESEESDPLAVVDCLKELLCDMDKVARSGLSGTDSSDLYRKHSEFIEKFPHLESMVNRIDCIFSREKIRNMEKILDDCQTTLHGFRDSLKDFQNIKEFLEKQIEELITENQRQRQHQQSLVALNEKLREDQKNLPGQYNSRLENIEDLLIKLNQKKD